MASVAEELINTLKKMPREDRVPVIKAILQAAGRDVEARVLQREQGLRERGDDPKTALVNALEDTIQEPGGERILKVLAFAASREAAKQGLIKPSQVDQIAKQYEGSLRRQEHLVVDGGLGFVGTIITAAAAVLSLAASGISATNTRIPI